MRFAYDGANRQTDVFNGEGERTQTSFDGEGNRLSVTPPAQPPTRYSWDELGKLLSVTQPATVDHGAAVTSFGYDRNRNKIRQTNAREFDTTYSYDSMNRLETMTEPAATASPASAPTSVTPAQAGAHPQLSAPLYGPLVTTFGYDPQGNVTSVTDPKGQVETNTYDTLNRKERTDYTPAPGAPSSTWRDVVRTQYFYDENDNPIEAREFVRSGTDPPGTSSMTRTIVRTFDDFDRVETETTTLPDGGTKTIGYEYFLNGTRRALIDANGLRTEYTYDGKNRVRTTTTEAATPQAKTTTHAYFADDLLRQTLGPNGVVAERTYDRADRLKTLTNTSGAALVSSYEYGYDGNGNRTSQIETLPPPITTPGAPAQPAAAETTGYSYDDANRLKQVIYPADSTYPFGRVVTYHYDEVGNREREVETLPAVIPAQPSLQGAPILERVGTFDANNRLTALTTTVAPPTVPPSYVAPPDVTPAEAESHVNSTLVIAYDLNGNELSRTRTLTDAPGTTTTTLSTWNIKDHLVEQSRTVAEIVDGTPVEALAGRNPVAEPIERSAVEAPGTRNPVAEPIEGSPVEAPGNRNPVAEPVEGSPVEAPVIIARFEYDAEGRRTKKIGEEGIRQYVYDDTSLLAEYNSDGLEVAKYDYGADRLIRLTRADEGTRYMTFDGLGSVTGLTDAAGAVTATYHLDAWGQFRFKAELVPSHNRFGFTGHYWDKEASLYYAKARYYDPFTARFTQSDSFLGTIDNPPSLHRYQYANANPTRFVDLTGYAADEPGYWSTFAYHLSKGISEAPGRMYDRFVGMLTPGDEGNEGHTAEAQRKLLSIAGNEKLDPVSRTLATMEAVKLQGAVVVEEAIVRPASEAPANARRAGVYANDALAARDGTTMAVGVLGVIASSSEAFGGLLPLAPGRSIGRRAIGSVETQLIREGEQSVARAGATSSGGTTVTPWGTRSNATGKFGEGPRGGLDPVDDFIEHAKASGYEVLGKEISFKTPFETRHVDVVIRNPQTGKIGGVEIKSSAEEFAKLKPEQFAADRWINRFGAKAVGKNAKAAGVTSIDHTVKIQWPPLPQ